MKQIIAIIRPDKLKNVQDALNEINIKGLTITDVQGYGRQKGHKEIFRGVEYDILYTNKIKLEIVVDEQNVEQVIDCIIDNARSESGKIGDGKIFVLDVVDAIRIRTGEKGSSAL